jgi:predicted RNase H-like HicB family nuclease/predicted RNA binding protein YcfA (HicA-like mRNA interferase family)
MMAIRNMGSPMPEFVQCQFNHATGKGRRFGKMRLVKLLKEAKTFPGTNYPTEHQMDLAASLPIAARFRELLELKGDRYYWRTDYKKALSASRRT